MIKTLLAKSGHTTLLDHSQNVSDLAVKIASIGLKGGDRDRITKMVQIAGLLHDVGKATDNFQNFLATEKVIPFTYTHNEIGWAYLDRFVTHTRERCEVKSIDMITDAVYWHHAISKTPNSHSSIDVLNSVDVKPSDIMKMCVFVKDIFEQNNITDFEILKDEKSTYHNSPNYLNSDNSGEGTFRQDFDYIRMFIRNCIISADKIVSKLEASGDVNQIKNSSFLDQYINRNTPNIIAPIDLYGNSVRFQKQCEVIEDIVNSESNSVIIAAPAGFGKTLLGLLWNLQNGRKLIWVCPTNLIAQSVYHSIKSELETMNLVMTAELFLTDNVVDHNHINTMTSGFDSDIIVTNIDNYLRPVTENTNSDRLFMINSCDVVFDEYHELVGDAALFALFVNMMKTRNSLNKAKTILLSATPVELEYLWDNSNSITERLPKKYDHYDPVHFVEYQINIVDHFEIDTKEDDTLTIFNTIKEAQAFYIENDLKLIAHSDFYDAKRLSIFKDIYDKYGKNTKYNSKRLNVVGTHIIQSSMDVSFATLNEVPLSPDSTIQRIGRCNRHGDSHGGTINILKAPASSATIVRQMYDTDLNKKWNKSLEALHGVKLNLADIYKFYNKFNQDNALGIKNYIDKRYNKSVLNLAKIYPYKKKPNVPIKSSANGNKLRTTSRQIYYITRMYDNNSMWSEPLTTKIYESVHDDFGQGNINGWDKKIRNQIKAFVRNKDYGFGDHFSGKIGIKKIDKIALGTLELMSVYAETPYIRYNKVYHVDLGMISEDIQNLLKKYP